MNAAVFDDSRRGRCFKSFIITFATIYSVNRLDTSTVKPFNLAALKVGNFTCSIVSVPFVLANSNHAIPTRM